MTNLGLDHLFPLIVPRSYVRDTTWDLPHHPLPHNNFILTWVRLEADVAVTYLTRAEHQAFEATQPSWQRVTAD